MNRGVLDELLLVVLYCWLCGLMEILLLYSLAYTSRHVLCLVNMQVTVMCVLSCCVCEKLGNEGLGHLDQLFQVMIITRLNCFGMTLVIPLSIPLFA
jgi:hypothetical protein